MIDLSLYRQRIGSFYQAFGNTKNVLQKSCKTSVSLDRISYLKLVTVYLLLLCSCLTAITIMNIQQGYSSENRADHCTIIDNIDNFDYPCSLEIGHWTIWTQFSGNFFARYFNGNGRGNGIRVYHLNIRKLQNKVSEIKSVVSDLKPHMISLSECELYRDSPSCDLSALIKYIFRRHGNYIALPESCFITNPVLNALEFQN